jgi:hypothetical protein
MSVPSAPQVIYLPDSRNQEIQFYWGPPSSGSPITNYTIFSTNPPITCNTGPITDLTYTISGLTNGSNYSFAITADNSIGTSPSTLFQTVNPGNAPSNPTSLSSFFVNSSNVNIYWSTPTTDGGSPIYKYAVWIFPVDSSNTVLSNLAIKKYTFGNVFTRNVNLPYSNSNYRYTVRAINDADWSPDNPSLYGSLTSYSPGFIVRVYNGGYFADNVNWFASNTVNYTASNITIMSNISTATNGNKLVNGAENYSVQWTGYFYCLSTGSHTFFTESDDASYLWLGSNAISGFTSINALVNNGGPHAVQQRSGTSNLTANTYYPIRMQFGELGGGDDMRVSFTPPSGTRTYNFTNYAFSLGAANFT